MEPVRKALNYYTHMGKTMEEELKKEQVKKHSREENEKVTKFSIPADNNSPTNVVILISVGKQHRLFLSTRKVYFLCSKE